MSNGNVYERLWRLQTKINMLVSDGKRDPVMVADLYQRILQEEARVIPRWREEDSVIYFSVTSDGTTGKDWIKRLEGNGFRVGDYAKEVLCSPSFKPTKGVQTEVAVFKGMLFEEQSRITSKIRAEGALRKLSKSNAELACLIREKFTDEEIEAMGLVWIVAMHEPIKESDSGPLLLSASRCGGGRWLTTCRDRPGFRWPYGHGFAFAVVASQFSTLRLSGLQSL